jgi:hypothetical protein
LQDKGWTDEENFHDRGLLGLVNSYNQRPQMPV